MFTHSINQISFPHPVPCLPASFRGEALETASSLLALVALSGGVAASPLEMLRQHLRRCLEAVAVSLPAEDGGGGWGSEDTPPAPGPSSKDNASKTADGANAVARFCCGLMRFIPSPLIAPLAERVILPAASEVRNAMVDGRSTCLLPVMSFPSIYCSLFPSTPV
jgi:hypothetical protein